MTPEKLRERTKHIRRMKKRKSSFVTTEGLEGVLFGYSADIEKAMSDLPDGRTLYKRNIEEIARWESLSLTEKWREGIVKFFK